MTNLWHVESQRDQDTLVYSVQGQLFFASTEALTQALDFHNDARTVVLDLGAAHVWDESATAAIRGAIQHFENNNNQVQIRGIDRGSCGLVRRLYGEEEF